MKFVNAILFLFVTLICVSAQTVKSPDGRIVLDFKLADGGVPTYSLKFGEKTVVGAITDENSRTASFSLDFLAPNKEYLATIYSDGADAQWDRNPSVYKIDKYIVTNGTKLKLLLAEGGGAAVSIVPATTVDLRIYNRKK